MNKQVLQFIIEENNPTGIIECFIDDWFGISYKIPRNKLKEAANLDYIGNTGVYILFGDDENTAEKIAYIGEAENIYVVTLSGKLSGSYNSAVLAANLYNEEHEDAKKNIHVFNSKSASIGETIIGLKCQEYEEAGFSFEEVCEKTEEYISSMNTFFVLETLETLKKAGRLSNLKAFVANTLNIKPVMGSTKEGSIQQLSQARGMKKALSKMVDDMMAATKDCENRVLAIAHCNCPERAQYVKECIEKIANFKEILIVNTAGVSSMYANDGGVILAV